MSLDFANEICKLSNLQNRLLEPCENDVLLRFQTIEQSINHEIPNAIKRLLSFSNYINDIPGMFSGYELHRLDQLEEIYVSKNKPLSFFGEYKLDSSFNLLDDTIEIFYEDPDHENTEPVIVTNMSRFLPLARHKGDYLVVDLLSENGEGIYEIMLGYSAYLYAHSVRQHIDYLINSFENGSLTIEDNYMDFPVHWYHRST